MLLILLSMIAHYSCLISFMLVEEAGVEEAGVEEVDVVVVFSVGSG